MRHLLIFGWTLLVFAGGSWGSAASASICQRATIDGACLAFEPHGVEVSVGPWMEPNGLEVSVGPLMEPGGTEVSVGPLMEPGGLHTS